jgi:hypothetical protein
LEPSMCTYPVNYTDAQLEKAYAAGMMAKAKLEDGRYYRGECRNASIARWCAELQAFVHWTFTMGGWHLDLIHHPEDEKRYDVFLAFERIEPATDDVIPDGEFEEFVAFYRKQ